MGATPKLTARARQKVPASILHPFRTRSSTMPDQFNDLYQIDGTAIVTHSMIKTFRRCPHQAKYKYVDRLKPRIGSQPLERGKWMHSLLEAHYSGGDWREEHKRLRAKYNQLFDEEKEVLGDLPTECARLMLSYLWHYAADPLHGWVVHQVEYVIECKLPDGSIYRGKVDLLVENEYGLWIVDHKTHKTLPTLHVRLLDAQSALYLWAALRSGLKVQGFIWNYIRTKPPTVPQLLKSGDRLSKRSIETDYPTLVRAIKKYELDPDPYRDQLVALKRQRWTPGAPQTSPFFQRHILEKGDKMLARVAAEAFHTHTRMREYDFGMSERVTDRSCEFMCSYKRLCPVELSGGNAAMVRRDFRTGDPHDYYDDEKERASR